MRGDFKVSIDSEFVFRNQVVFDSKRKIDALNDRTGIVLRATMDFNNETLCQQHGMIADISPVSAILLDS